MSKKNKQDRAPSKQEIDAILSDGHERMLITDEARRLLGFPAARVVSLGKMKLGPMPRYRNFVICLRAALYGFTNPTVRHMVDRNRRLDEFAALERMAASEGLA